jgi:RHS repeat-associated protein
MTVNSTGDTTSWDDYDAWGMLLEQRSGNLGQPNSKYKFIGKELDQETGYDYFGARYYDARMGRWLSVDPLAKKYPSWSSYVYTLNNPVTFFDAHGDSVSSGLEWLSENQSKRTKSATNQGYPGQGLVSLTYSVLNGIEKLTGIPIPEVIKTLVSGTAFGLPGSLGSMAGRAQEVAEAMTTAKTAGGQIGATKDVGENALKALGGEPQAFFKTSMGDRFIDQLVNGVAYESKVGYTTLTERISLQIDKDVELMHTGQIQDASWHFFQSPVTGQGGPSEPLLRALLNAKIGVEIH